jgi:hypothetical protein
MGIIRTTASLLSGIRTVTDRVVEPALDTTVDLLPWLNEAARELQVIVATAAPEEYGAVSSSFTIPSGNTFAMAAGGADGVAQAAFLGFLGLDWSADGGVHWLALKKARFAQRGRSYGPGWRRRKRTLIIEPQEAANLYPFRYHYVEAPEALVNGGGEDIDLPFGGDQFVIQHCAALVRAKFEEDPLGHLALKEAARKTVMAYLDSDPREPILGASPDNEDDD